MRHLNTYHLDVFDRIDTEEKAYWFGFICADGCIRMCGRNPVVEVTLTQKDEAHLAKLRDFLCPSNKLYQKKRKLGDKVFHHVQLVVSSKTIAEQLIALGCGFRKSLTLPWPKTVPKKWIVPFMRGYFDGDGSVYITKADELGLSIEGNDKFLRKYRDQLIQLIGISYTKVYKDNRSENRSYKKQGVDALKIVRLLYKDASIYLRRKLEVVYAHRRLQMSRKNNCGKNREP